MNAYTKTKGYKLNLSLSSYVCEKCVDEEKERVINNFRHSEEQGDI